jgi:hypothetical protein
LAVPTGPSRVLIESGAPGPEESAIAAEARRRGIAVDAVTRKLADRRALPIDSSTLAVGTVRFIRGALAQLGAAFPVDNTYPHALEPYLERRVWRTTLEHLDVQLVAHPFGLFIKPADRVKRFTGFVVNSSRELGLYGITSRNTPLWCADHVTWLSEWRAYVIGGRVVGLGFASGREDALPSNDVISQAVADLEASTERRAGYALDFGVLDSGRTALIEYNDGFALGLYQIAPNDYFDLLWVRWQELVQNKNPAFGRRLSET